MTPLTTYTTMTVVSSAASFAALSMGAPGTALTVLTLGLIAAAALGAQVPMQPPYWAEGCRFPYPRTAAVAVHTAIIEAVTLGFLLQADNLPATWIPGAVRAIGFLFLMTRIGGLQREFRGEQSNPERLKLNPQSKTRR